MRCEGSVDLSQKWLLKCSLQPPPVYFVCSVTVTPGENPCACKKRKLRLLSCCCPDLP